MSVRLADPTREIIGTVTLETGGRGRGARLKVVMYSSAIRISRNELMAFVGRAADRPEQVLVFCRFAARAARCAHPLDQAETNAEKETASARSLLLHRGRFERGRPSRGKAVRSFVAGGFLVSKPRRVRFWRKNGWVSVVLVSVHGFCSSVLVGLIFD